MDILSEEFTIKVTKTDAEALAKSTRSELANIKNKNGIAALKKCGRLLELNSKFSKMANVKPFDELFDH